MGDNYYVKTFCGISNPPDDELMKVTTLMAGPAQLISCSVYLSSRMYNGPRSKVQRYTAAHEGVFESSRCGALLSIVDMASCPQHGSA